MPVVPALMKHVVIPSIGAAAIGGGIAAAPATMDLVGGKSGRKAMDRILSEDSGPGKKLSNEDYAVGLDDQFLNIFGYEIFLSH